MRLLLSFLGAVLIALALFGLMLLLVMPPRDDSDPQQELARVNFVRSVQDSDSERRERQPRELPDRPQPPEPMPQPQPPRPEQPRAELELNISVPNLASPISVSSEPPRQALVAAPSAPVDPAPAPVEPAPAPSAEISEEVTPLVDVPPNYPQRALSAGIEGEVTLAFTITAEGRVENLRVTHAEPPGVFDREARRAAARWRFAPRTEGGQPVAREATKTLYFRLEGRR